MTLSTDIYVIDPVPVGDLFIECQRLLSLFDEDKRGPEQQRSKNEQDKTWRAGEAFVEPDNAWTWMNEGMQGLPAWLMIRHRNGEPYRTPEQSVSHAYDGYCNYPGNDYFDANEPVCAKTEHDPACWAEVDLDTAYGYRGPNGIGCGDLHALIVAALGQQLTANGIRWKWRNEFTGEIHDDPARLIDLVSGGFEASAWFTTSVMPVISAITSGEVTR